MALSTNQVAGLSSGFDWRTMVDQLMAVEHRRVDLVNANKTDSEKKLTEWQSLNTKLLAFKTAAGNLKTAGNFGVYKSAMTTDSATVKASDLLAVTPSSTASAGSYTVKVNALAAAQKVSSGTFTSTSGALGAGYAGDILINGKIISISASDTLINVKDKINNANAGATPTGVTASILTYGTNDYRLVLTSDNTGAAGIGLLNGGATDILNKFGFIDTNRTAKNHLAGGDRTDRFSSTSISIKSLLGLTTTQTSLAGNIVINGQAVGAIDLSTDTLSTLQTKFAAAGLTASITSETENSQTYYRLMVSGAANTYTDKNNILETLGFIKGGVSDVSGVGGDVANTAGGKAITAATLLKDIDGYTGYQITDYIQLTGTNTSGIPVSDSTFTITSTATVGDLLTKIQSVFGNVTASITGDGKLTVMANPPGASPLAVTIGVKDLGGAADNTLKFDVDGILAATTRKRQIVAGADASVTVDGVTSTRTKNTINDIITGVTLDLLKADASTTVSLNIGRDIDAIMAKVDAFVASYNSISSYIGTQTSYDATKKKPGGVLFGDGTLMSVKSDLTSTLMQNVWGVSAAYSTLGLVGVTVDKAGQLSVDRDKLRGYLTTNFNDVQKLFTASGVTGVGTLEYIGQTTATKAGNYAVSITTAATQSASAPSNNTSLSGAETLTITEGSSAAVVSLTSSMTMAQIVNAINSETATTYTQVLAGAKQLYADNLQTAKITAATKWNSVYDSLGGSAGLINGDVITFSGVSHNAGSVSGSYTITNVATDSVQGLLSVVETAFGNQVTAAIDANGRIIVTDKTPGSSSVALSFNYAQAHALDFGSVLTGNTGGQKGRYAMGITASADAGNHLVLTHNSYGTGHSFTIHQLNNLLWTGGDQIVNNGLNVAGTINGEAATGVGQILTGNSGDANVAGLAVKYTGAMVGAVGSITLTLGVAELFDRTLFNITDAYAGYAAFKQTSLQRQVTGINAQVTAMEARLDKKKEQMINKFVAMELTLSRLQNQGNWLAGQIKALSQ